MYTGVNELGVAATAVHCKMILAPFCIVHTVVLRCAGGRRQQVNVMILCQDVGDPHVHVRYMCHPDELSSTRAEDSQSNVIRYKDTLACKGCVRFYTGARRVGGRTFCLPRAYQQNTRRKKKRKIRGFPAPAKCVFPGQPQCQKSAKPRASKPQHNSKQSTAQ